MKEVLKFIITEIVDEKDVVTVEETTNRNFVLCKVKVSKNDMGHVIGKYGKMAKSIRSVMSSIANKEHKKISVEFEAI